MAWLNKMFSTELPTPGRARLAEMLSHDGRLKGDLTLFNWGDGIYWIMGIYYLRQWHMRWFNDNMDDGVTAKELGGFSLSGPKFKTVMEPLHTNAAALKFMGCGDFDIGLIRAKVARMSIAGEMGFEIDCRMIHYEFNAMLSLRLEKSFGIRSAEFTRGYTAGATAMDRWIDCAQDGFIGRDAAIAERTGNGLAQVQVTLEIKADVEDASGYEPTWVDGKQVGFVSSSGYGHTVDKSLAMALVDPEFAAEGTTMTVHVVGVERACKVNAASPYDPDGKAMRG